MISQTVICQGQDWTRDHNVWS